MITRRIRRQLVQLGDLRQANGWQAASKQVFPVKQSQTHVFQIECLDASQVNHDSMFAVSAAPGEQVDPTDFTEIVIGEIAAAVAGQVLFAFYQRELAGRHFLQ